ncbi:MAG TPA: hypothetical protein DCW95_01235 [Chryseobacterium sp.]|nr:hypothetical protein [Chryseobacterium sp.]
METTLLTTLRSFMRHRAYRHLMFVSVLTLIVGMVAMHYLEGWSWLDGLYFSVSTVTTTGYGDLYPETTNGKIFVVFYQIISVGIILLFFNTIYQHFDDVKNSQRIRRYRHKKMVKRAMREQKRREQKEKNTHN